MLGPYISGFILVTEENINFWMYNPDSIIVCICFIIQYKLRIFFGVCARKNCHISGWILLFMNCITFYELLFLSKKSTKSDFFIKDLWGRTVEKIPTRSAKNYQGRCVVCGYWLNKYYHSWNSGWVICVGSDKVGIWLHSSRESFYTRVV